MVIFLSIGFAQPYTVIDMFRSQKGCLIDFETRTCGLLTLHLANVCVCVS